MIMSSFFSLLDRNNSNYSESDMVSTKISSKGVSRQSDKITSLFQEEKYRKRTVSPDLHLPKGSIRVEKLISNVIRFAFFKFMHIISQLFV